MNAKRLTAFIAAVLMAGTLAACGGKPKTPSTSGNGTNAATGETSMSSSETDASAGPSETTQTGGSPNSGDKNPVKTTKTAAGNQNTPTKTQTPGQIDKDVLIKAGTKKMEEGLNFGGKTFTMACGVAPTNRFKRLLAAFQKQYNCKINTEVLDFAQYTQQVVAKITSGSTYDLLQLEGSRYPNMVITNTCEPIEDVITTADWSNKAKPEAGGFSESLSMAFAWNNHLYGVLGTRGEYAPQPNLIWYNDKLIKQAGTDDPRELYESGKWTFDAMKKIGLDVKKNTSAMLSGAQLLNGNMVSANGGWYVKYDSKGTQPKSNLTDSRIANAYKYIQSLTTGNNAVVDLTNNYDHNAFFQGKTAFWAGAPYHLSANFEMAKNVEASNAFGKSLKNLKVVPLPMGPDNKEKAVGVGWLYAFAAGKGTSDKRAAVAWAKFATTFNDPVKDEYVWSDKDQKMIHSLVEGNVIYRNYAFADASNTIYELVAKMEYEICEGKDISQQISTYNALFQNCISVSLKG